jgi:thioredoxin-related protein
MAAKPIVDRLEQDWTTGQIVRVDVLSSVGREFANRHDFQGTPTFVLFDGAGNEVQRWRGRPPELEELTSNE